MRAKYFLIGFVFLNIIVLSSVVLGKKDFETDVEAGTDIIWVCNILDDKSMKDIFQAEDWLERDVPDWDDYGFWEDIEQGSRMRWHILHARDESSFLTMNPITFEDYSWDTVRLKFKLWKWTDDLEWDDPDYKKARAHMHADPEDIGSDLRFLMPYDYGHDLREDDPTTPTGYTGTTKSNIFYEQNREYYENMVNHYSGNWYQDYDDRNDNLMDIPAQIYRFPFPSWGLPMWISQDVDDYLDDMEFDEHRFDVDDKALTITARIKEQSFDYFDIDPPSGHDFENYAIYELPNEDIKWKATYNEQGFMSNFKLWNDDHDLVCEFSLQMLTIPGYEIPVMLVVMGLSVIAVIYIVMKKRR